MGVGVILHGGKPPDYVAVYMVATWTLYHTRCVMGVGHLGSLDLQSGSVTSGRSYPAPGVNGHIAVHASS